MATPHNLHLLETIPFEEGKRGKEKRKKENKKSG